MMRREKRLKSQHRFQHVSRELSLLLLVHLNDINFTHRFTDCKVSFRFACFLSTLSVHVQMTRMIIQQKHMDR